ncbi:MAG: DNA phosphorothioation system sulfurtransferase DndC [Arcicella sp.]|nr:DNA phosphorothioation system sulfurtransferase DndC [Arcicella sp.]
MLDHLKHIEAEIIDQFLLEDNNRPWIIGFSGGKDSTMLLQMVWYALKKIDPVLRSIRKLYIVCNDTMVENPKIADFIYRTLKNIEKAAVIDGIDITIEQTRPKLEETFWVNLLGRGYPAPNNIFRWCTERLKINPTTKRILEKIDENGEVIILLGTRSEESSRRARSIKKHQFGDNRLRKHVLPNAFTFAPIKDFTTEEVWTYLTNVHSPWAGRNTELITLYRNASGGDCPLVIDTSTPSCGNSRFGCWVCTVVKRDSSMEALIDNGEDWMLPLLELREVLAESRDNIEWREQYRRNGQEAPGPYKPEYRALLLKKLLEAQKSVQETEPQTELITHQELVAIQILWYRDSIFNHQVSGIYNQIFNSEVMKADKIESQRKKENEILGTVCKKNPNHVDLINDLLNVQKTKILMRNKVGLSADMETQLERFLKKKTIKATVNAD